MRYLKRQTLNRRVANDPSLYVDINGQVVMGNNSDLLLPSGSTSQQPAGTTPGRIRYNNTKGNVEVYQGGKWRALRYQESGTIFQQNLGAGDSNTVFFGPLNSTYYNPNNVSNGNSTYGGQNIIVIVENVIQVSGINYTITQLPGGQNISGETYNGSTSATATIGAHTLYLNTSINATSASGTGSTVTYTFPTQSGIPFATGATVVVTGFIPSSYNGTYTVLASPAPTTSSFSVVCTALATVTFPGTITATSANGAIFPAVGLVGASVSGSGILPGTTISSIDTDPYTDALLSITMNNGASSSINSNTNITITQTSSAGSGSYLQFTSPVPYGKVVIALLGFDQ
jgi:hypothetical protein